MSKYPAASDYRPTYRWAIRETLLYVDGPYHYLEADSHGQPSLDSYDSRVCVWNSKRAATAALAALVPEGADPLVYGNLKVRRVDTGTFWDECHEMVV